MLTKDIYGKKLSNSFNSAISSYAQFVKPKITIKLLDSRHLTLSNSIINNDSHIYDVTFNSTNDTILIPIYNFSNGCTIKFTSVPANSNINANQEYYIVNANTTSRLYKLSTTSGGSAINITANGNATVDNSTVNTLGYYFTEKQALNGFERQSFTWAVCDAKEKDGTVIKADGTWHALPSNLDDNYEYGWWTKSKSQANGVFASSPTLTIPIEPTKINKIKIVTSEFYGQVKQCTVVISNTTYGNLLNKVLTFDNDEFYKEITINSNIAITSNYIADQISISIDSTKNGNDHGRIQEICPYYEVDITDYIMNFSLDRTRDVHESSLPIGGSQSSKVSITIDNTTKDWNIFNTNSKYGKYMAKDLKVNIAAGWRIKKTEDSISQTTLRSNISNSSTSISVIDTDILPVGGVDNYFIITIDPDTDNEEIILCNTITDNTTITVVQRGYASTTAVSHTTGAVVRFDPYEYVPMGEFYIDEWSTSANDMSVSISASDYGKFLNEKTLTKGFLFSSTQVGEVVENLLLRSNFPKKNIKYIKRYSKDISAKGGVARYTFNEGAIDRDGVKIELDESLRCRFWGMSAGEEYNYQNIYADILDKQLTTEDLAKNLKAYTPASYTALSKDISTSYLGNVGSVCLNNYFFTSDQNSTEYKKYFNGVIDGYYIPATDGNQDLIVDIQNGGARVFLDDTLISSNWKENTTLTSISAYTYRGNSFLNLTAGTPYRLRIEFFHGSGDGNFILRLYKNNSTLTNKTLVTNAETRTTSAKDTIGSRDASFLTSTADFNHHQNDGIYYSNCALTQVSGIVSENNNYSSTLSDGGYIRIPNHSSISISEKNFSYEIFAKFENGVFSGTGEYLSSWSNATPTSGFEFYSNTSGHGLKIISSSGVQTVSNSTILGDSYFAHIIATYNANTKLLSYYLDGELAGSTTVSGTIATQASDITIGGRGSSFTSGAPVAPSLTRDFTIDEFAIYKKCLSSDDILERYYSSQIESLELFQYLYGVDETIRQSIDEISLAGLGRFYIDEENNARYEHYKRFYEPFIAQHSEIQYDFSDSTNILGSDLQVQLQANKVTVKVPQVKIESDVDASLWQAEDPTTLLATDLQADLNVGETYMTVSSTVSPDFYNSGYVIVDNEIIKYNSKNGNQFLDLTRAQLGTVEANHVVGAKVREVKIYQLKFDKAPAFSIKAPLVAAISREEPDLINILKFDPTPYSAELILAASNSVPVGGMVYVEGKDPEDNALPYYTTIAGIPVLSSENSEQASDQVESLNDNIRKYGLKEIIIDNKFITNIDYAKELCKFIIDNISDPVPIINLDIMSVPTLQLGDRIRITTLDAFDIINGEYWVVSQNFSYADSISHNLVLRKAN